MLTIATAFQVYPKQKRGQENLSVHLNRELQRFLSVEHPEWNVYHRVLWAELKLRSWRERGKHRLFSTKVAPLLVSLLSKLHINTQCFAKGHRFQTNRYFAENRALVRHSWSWHGAVSLKKKNKNMYAPKTTRNTAFQRAATNTERGEKPYV